MFYNYIYLDPRKPGKYCYDELNVSFLYEPFYVGKGQGDRCYEHLNVDQRNTFRTGKINKILSLGFDIKKFIFIFNHTNSEQAAWDNEVFTIAKIGRVITEEGPLTNFAPGGAGGDTLSNHPNKDAIIEKLKRIGEAHWSYNKTYEEVYGENRAIIEKQKRSKSFFKTGSRDIKTIEKQKETKKKNNKPVWNKGKKGLQESWNKGRKYTSKCYELINLLTGEIFEATGYKELDIIIKQINNTLAWKDKIKKCELLKSDFKNFKLKIKNEKQDITL
jgi:hypothetical protein